MLLRIVEYVSVIGVFLVIWYAAWFLVTKEPANPTRQRMLSLLQTINDNWKAFLLLGIPMFYRTVRTFLEEVQEAGGMKRGRQEPKEPASAPNRPSQGNP
jgi:hypothetical protein